jgi:hypothetical protein
MERRSAHPSPPIRRTARTGLALGATLALVMAAPGTAQTADDVWSISSACRGDTQAAERFGDIDGGGTHDDAIRCLGAYGIVQGFVADEGGFEYRAGQDVTRQQMASYIADALREVPNEYYALPDGGDPGFDDAQNISEAHAANVADLQEAGILTGYDDGTFRPDVTIDRAQMASFIARSIERVTGEELPRGDGFDDVSGAHEENIEKLQGINIVGGKGDGTYDPDGVTTRAQMASFIARSLSYLIEQGQFIPMDYQEPTATSLFVTDAEAGEHETGDRVTFTLEGDDGQVGWEIRYTDDPVAHGSGEPVEVEGEAVLEVILTGVTYSEDPDDTWADAISVEGDGIVEVESVSTYEGRYQVFIGTTGLNWFDADRVDGPERAFIDVAHGS